MSSKTRYQPACYILGRNLTLPFSRKLLFPMMFSGCSKLLITGKVVNSSPTEFEIIIGDRGNEYMKMHQLWNEGRAEFSYFVDVPYFEECWNFPQYARFPSLRPGSDFTIAISTVLEHPGDKAFHFKVRVNDDPVVMFRHGYCKDSIDVAEVVINSPNNDINVTLVQLDVT